MKNSTMKHNLIQNICSAMLVSFLFLISIAPQSSHLYYSEEILKKDYLLDYLQSSVSIYTSQNRIPPKTFSDFILLSDEEDGQYTINLKYRDTSILGVTNPNTTEMIIKYSDNTTETYYLSGTNITSTFNKQKALDSYEKGMMMYKMLLFLIFSCVFALLFLYKVWIRDFLMILAIVFFLIKILLIIFTTTG